MAADTDDICQDVLNRMRKAHEKGRGVRLSFDDLEALSIGTSLGELWDQPDPRKEP